MEENNPTATAALSSPGGSKSSVTITARGTEAANGSLEDENKTKASQASGVKSFLVSCVFDFSFD